MTDTVYQRVAQFAWILPLFFVALSFHQGKVAYDLYETKTRGTPATADVREIHIDNRKDVTYDYISLRVELPDGTILSREQMSLPHGLVPVLEGKETLEVRVHPGGAREIAVTEQIESTPVVDTQIRIAGLNGLMSFGAALLFGVGVWFWNRSLRRSGDPSARGISEPDPDHPARKVLR